MDLQNLVIRISVDDSSVNGGINRAKGKMSGFSKVGATVFGAFQRVGMKAVDGVFGAISSGVDGAVRRFDTLNNFTNVMTSLGFDAGKAEEAINGLADGIGHLPTTLDAVAAQAQQLVPMTNNIGKAKDITLALNNAMAAGGGSAEGQKNAIENWTKSMAKGKPEFEAWQSMVQAAPAQMDQLAKAMLGTEANQNTLYEAMKEGAVTMDEVNQKMIDLTNAEKGFDIGGKHFENWAVQAKNASAGIQMSMINIRAAIQRNLANALESANHIFGEGGIAGALQSIVPIVDTVGASISSMLSGDISFEAGISTLLNQFDVGVMQFIDKGSDIIANLMNGMADAAPVIMDRIGVVLRTIGTTIGENAPMLIDAGINLIMSLIEGIIQMAPEVATAIAGLFTTDESVLSGISDTVQTVVGVIESVVNALGAENVIAIIAAFATFGPVVSALSKVFTVLSTAASVLTTVIGFLASPVGLIVIAITALIAIGVLLYKNWDTIKEKASELGQAISEKFEEIKTAISEKIEAAKEKVQEAVEKIKAFFDFSNAGSKVSGAFDSIRSAIQSKIDAAKAKVSSAVNSIKSTLSFAGIAGKVSGVFNSIRSTIQSKLNAAKSAVSNAISRIKSILSGSLSLPKIKLPHFSFSGKFSLNPPSVPHFSVSWYKKAMDEPYLFRGATLFGAGEAGDEILYGRSALLEDIREASSNGGDTFNIYLNYNAGDDANDMLKDIARGIQRYKMAGVI